LFIDGVMAARFREDVQKLMDEDQSLDEVDEFLGQFDSLMQQPVVLH
jgi:hypothetical protein